MNRAVCLFIPMLSLATPATAQEPVPARNTSLEEPRLISPGALSPQSPLATDEADQSGEPLSLAPLSREELDSQRGGNTIVIGNQTLTAITAGGLINGDYTAGSVTFSDQAFSQFHGLGNVLVNTGAFANLQGGISVVINTDPGQ